MRTAGFLVRNPEGEYRFAHKSYAEFFVACHIAALLEQGDVRCLHVPPRITKEHLAFVVDLIKAPGPVEQLLAGHLTESYVPNLSENALLCLAALRRARAQSPRALVELPAHMRLERAQLAGTRLSDLGMRNAVLTGARLSVCDLRHTDLSSSDLRGADCSNALMSGAILDQALCVDANFTEADLQGVSVIDTDMTRADLSNAILTNTVLDDRHEVLKHSIGIQRTDQALGGPKSDELVSFVYETMTHAVGEDSPDLDDLVQEVFLRLSMSRTGGQTEDRETMRTRIFALRSRILYDYYRRRSKNEEAYANILTLAETTHDEAAGEALRWDRLEDALEIEVNALAPLSREIFLLRRQGVGFDEIAKLIARSSSAVRKIHAQTAAILRARLADLEQ
jgi:RNA polymerase sigma factor (sigma-70 family)